MWRMLYNNKINVCDSVFHPRFIYVIINSSTVDFMFLFNNLASDHEHEFENEHAARGQNMWESYLIYCFIRVVQM